MKTIPLHKSFDSPKRERCCLFCPSCVLINLPAQAPGPFQIGEKKHTRVPNKGIHITMPKKVADIFPWLPFPSLYSALAFYMRNSIHTLVITESSYLSGHHACYTNHLVRICPIILPAPRRHCFFFPPDMNLEFQNKEFLIHCPKWQAPSLQHCSCVLIDVGSHNQTASYEVSEL